jgi:hypothetical protein
MLPERVGEQRCLVYMVDDVVVFFLKFIGKF